jgi:DNA polymerase-3 subunit delta'
MSWSEVIGHENVVSRFQNAAAKGRLASTYLFVGPSGIGKRTFALKLAQAVFCTTNSEEELSPCGHCPACQQVTAASHPDLMQISKPKDKAFIPVETFIGDRDHRMQVGLCHDIGLKPFAGVRKVAIIDDADALNQESANALLKTLEEPPKGSIIILIGTSQHRQLSTIVSRSQVVRFEPLENGEVLSILGRLQIETDQKLDMLATVSGGSVARAVALSDSSVLEFREQLLNQLASLDPGSNEFTKKTTAFIDAAGKDSASKRVRAAQLADFAIDFYRQLMLSLSGQAVECDQNLANAITRAAENWQFDSEFAGHAVHRTMDFQRHIAANANSANATQCWYSDLGKLSRGILVPAV